MEIDGASAALLANMGVLRPATTPPADSGTPATPLPPPSGEGGKGPSGEGHAGAGAWESLEAHIVMASQDAGAPAGSSPGAQAATGYTAADFPQPVKVKALYTLAVMLHHTANPVATPEQPSPMKLWPPALATGRTPVIVAWLVTIAEIGGGALVLLGLCTRFSAFSLAGVMVGAMWLTQIGPALQSGKTQLGFLPQYPAFSMEWSLLQMQFILFCMAMGLMFTGPGFLAADHALFGGRRRHEDHDGE